MTNQEVVKCIFEWCVKYITIKNVMRASGILLMISLFLASVTPTGYFFGIKYIDVAMGCVGNIIICIAWIGIKTAWEIDQKEKEEREREKELERRRNGMWN